MDDEHRQPRDSDRNPVRDRIKRAVADGRITSADGDIRLGNVSSAQSVSELNLIVRDLDQLETSIAPTASTYAVPASDIAAAASGSGRKVWPVMILVFALVVVGAAAAGVFFISSGDDSSGSSSTGLGDPSPIQESPVPGSTDPTDPTDPTDEPSSGETSSATPAYVFSAAGIRSFLTTYQQRFGTTRAVTATFYGDYVVIQVPVAGTKRHSGWVYRSTTGFTDFGGVMTNFPGSASVDLTKLNVTALIANVSRAKRVLNVEDANQTYVTIDYRPQFDDAPNVRIYLTNKFNESGYLATTLSGTVERSYPFNAG